MAFSYEQGTANDVPDWFSKLETFLGAAGWSVISGSGTTTVVFQSPGEAGGRSKLYIRFRRDAANGQYVYFRVQNDATGTQATTETTTTYPGCLTAPGAGDVAFQYFMCADKDMVSANFKAGAAYSGCYAGIAARFALTVSDEEKEMVAVGLHTNGGLGRATGRVLKKYNDLWDQTFLVYTALANHPVDPLDGSYAVIGSLCDTGANVIGQLLNVCGRIESLGINPEDTVGTGHSGATTTWIVLGTGSLRWAIRTGGVAPTGTPEGAYFAHTYQSASSAADFHSKFFAFLQSVGWTITDRPVQQYPVDKHFYSQGESGVDDIWIRWYENKTPGSKDIGGYVMDNADEDHKTSTYMTQADEDDFPTNFMCSADRDCFVICIEVAGVYTPVWFGMFKVFNPDPDSLATPYKAGASNITGTRILRNHDGMWGAGVSEIVDVYNNSSPNNYDGVTYTVWPFPLKYTYPIGVMKYVYRLSGAALVVTDTVTVGSRKYKYVADKIAIRIA